jgi:hypothetical protein
MFGKLKSLFTRSRGYRNTDEYATMTADERRARDLGRERGAAGERADLIEHQAEGYIDTEEGRPREH